MKQRQWMCWQMGCLFVWWVLCFWFVIGVAGCAAGELLSDEAENTVASRCVLGSARYPTEEAAFTRLYAGRRFLVDGIHLGHDVALPEGTAVHPVGCGVVRIFRPSQGYGTLAVVIEHTLPEPFTVRAGDGSILTVTSFISIYGHMRTSALRNSGRVVSLTVGSVVSPQDTIGYVQAGDLNGDGGIHLHLGIRLQTARNAGLVDTNWFRGYDTLPSQRRWYADPAVFVPELIRFLQTSDGQVDASIPSSTSPPMMTPASPMTPVSMDAGISLDVGVSTADRGQVGLDAMSTTPRDAPVSSPSHGIRYEFRVPPETGLNASSPYALRNQWWQIQTCRNTLSGDPERLADGWIRCDLEDRVSPFDGSFFVPAHPDWGDAGQIGTVANTPRRCTFVNGVMWRISELTTSRRLYEGAVSGLRCVSVGSQDRLLLPD